MYSIGHVAEQVGISPATLRAWERRYAIVEPKRTPGDYRIYSPDDVRVLQSMKRLIDEGWSSGFAAREAKRRHEAVHLTPTPATAVPIGGELADQFVEAAAALDAARLDAILDQVFASGSFESAMDAQLFPALRALGDAWASGRVSVAGEHLASNAVSRRLAAAYDAAGSAGTGAPVVLGLAPGSRHELGLLAFAAAARRRGVETRYLGADVPVSDWVAAGTDPSVTAVVLAVPTQTDVAPAAQVMRALRKRAPHLVIAAGGAAQDSAPHDVVRLGDELARAAQNLIELTTKPTGA